MGICLALLHRPALKLQAAALTPLPSPASTNSNSTFATAAEALGMLLQVVGNLADKVQTKELDSIHSEDLILSQCQRSPAPGHFHGVAAPQSVSC